MSRPAVLLAFLTLLAAVPGAADPARVEALVGAMTLPEKVALMHGAEDPLTAAGSPEQRGAGYVPGVPRLGIPPLRLTDGPAGIRTAQAATALPAPVALAASFDPDLARRYGDVLGREALAANQDVVLAPMVNLVRVPQAGRNFETLGEDPLLAGRLAAAEIEGIQGTGAIATVKHLAANNQEDHREAVDAVVDPRTLHELYLPAFAAAVRAGVGAAMCGYNAVNGTPACQSRPLLDGFLRDELGFRGWVMSDWGATHTTLPSLEAGLDMEMWAGTRFGLLPELVPVPETRIDASVRRILGAMDRAGMLDGPRARPEPDRAAHASLAREVAIAGTVLLRNEGGLLPLAPADLGALALVGPAAAFPLTGGNGSSRVPAPQARSLLAVLGERAAAGAGPAWSVGDERDGVAIPAAALAAEDGPVPVDLEVPAGTTWRWSGRLTPPEGGRYRLALQGGPIGLDPASPWRKGGEAKLAVDGRPLLGLGGIFGGDAGLLPTADGSANASALLDLAAGRTYRLAIEATAGAEAPLRLRLAWVTPSARQQALDRAATVAKAARTAVVVVFDEAGEGRDRPSLALPGEQDALVEAVARANPRTVVVLVTGAPVLMPWLARTPAVLETWYPGVAGAEALADVLLGAADPGGRLPVTFPADPAAMPTAAPARYPGEGGIARYDEGLLMGYRWYDATGTRPLFPFGHGLSYARFAYADLAVRPEGDGRGRLHRHQHRQPAATRSPSSTSARPSRRRRRCRPAASPASPASTSPRASRRVTRRVSRPRPWPVAGAARLARPAPGPRRVEVGASSRDIRLTGRLKPSGPAYCGISAGIASCIILPISQRCRSSWSGGASPRSASALSVRAACMKLAKASLPSPFASTSPRATSTLTTSMPCPRHGRDGPRPAPRPRRGPWSSCRSASCTSPMASSWLPSFVRSSVLSHAQTRSPGIGRDQGLGEVEALANDLERRRRRPRAGQGAAETLEAGRQPCRRADRAGLRLDDATEAAPACR
ncbi:MAG: glycoside hydrolase family 3 C-terminal domain-containing protein [Geminicoccaceae bacterium]